MKKSYNPISDVRNESVEQTRRLYRAISDASRHLDDGRGRAQTCNDLFLPILETQRVKLREYCERLIFSDPIGYGRKGEELLWRKGYYDVVTTAKRLRKNNIWNPVEIAYMQGHLAAGVGHYHHLLFRLQIEYKLDLRGYVDFPLLVIDEGLTKDKTSSSKALDASCVEWAKQSVHRCLVYLGDLYRYVLDLHPQWDTGLAVRYYLQALHMNVDVGIPHNQLGSLSGTRNFGLDAAYHYMRCLTCKQPFEGAEGNLQRLLERNLQWTEEYYRSHNHQIECTATNPTEHLHLLVARFLMLIDSWFFDKSTNETHQVCHQMLLDLQQCLGYSKPFPSSKENELTGEQADFEVLPVFQGEDKENPTYLKDDLVCKMIVMSLLCVTKLQSSGSQQVSAVVAFTLAMFSQLVQQVIHNVQVLVFNESLPTFASSNSTTVIIASTNSAASTTTTTTTTTTSTVISPVDSHIKLSLPSDTVNSSDQTDKSCIGVEDSVAVVNGISSQGENAQDSKTAVKKKKVHRLRRRRRRRMGGMNSSEESDLSDDDFPYGSSSSSEAKSDISENKEPDLEVSSDEVYDDEEEEDDEEESDSKVLQKKSDDVKIDEKAIANDKSLNHVKDDSEHCNGITPQKEEEKTEDSTTVTSVNVNGLGEEGTSDSLILSNSCSTNFESALSKVVSGEEKDSDTNSSKKNSFLDSAGLIQLIANEGLLDAVKICADWLHGDSDIIKACGQSSRTLLSRFITLLNLINVDAKTFQNGSEGHFYKLKNIQDIFRKVPLPEDVMLKGLPVLKSVHKNIDWEYLKHHSLHAKEEALLRVYKLVEFGHFLASIPDIGIKYDAGQKLFIIDACEEKIEGLPVTNVVEENHTVANNTTASAVNQNSISKKGQLMHNMWLRAEVRDLESRVRRRGATFSPYLAVDSDALINYIHLVKQLVGARKFIVLIPAIVVSALDELKREIGKARETIRWLESQFQRGNRFLRAQRSHEKLPLPLMKYPKKKDKEAWVFFQVVECCHYFSQQTGIHETHPETALVTLLTGQKSAFTGGTTKDEGAKGFSPLGVAKSAGINLEHIESFHAKWKTSSKSHG